MNLYLFLFFVLIISIVIYGIRMQHQRKVRERFIESYRFPLSIENKIIEKYPHLTNDDAQLAMQGLRDYFCMCNLADKRMVSMPSQVVDVAWHEFILFTRAYQEFCKKGLSRFLHHVPAEAMDSPTKAQQGIKTAWRLACYRETINVEKPNRLPRIFAMDAELDIPDGFRYTLNCGGNMGYCASHIGCSSGCGGCSSGDGCSGGCGGD